MSSVEENIFLARVAEQAERFDDMVNFLSKVLDEKHGEVNSDERNLLSVAFKNLISSKRAACRTIAAIIPRKERIEIYFNGLYLSTSRIVCTIRDFAGTEDSLRRESDWGINWDGVRNRVF